jgi:uncharacterized membrane protein
LISDIREDAVLAKESTESAPAMDYPEHERTYAGFMEFTKLTIFGVINVLITLILFTITDAFWSGVLMFILTLVGVALGIMMKGAAKPSIGVMVIGLALFLLSLI